ncbi:endonuclease [Nocardioides sp. MAH-18]|uniref:Endonuclease n=1 Tax=Nocardioides agri TaxID=2682843 RepID=A0A6L6XW82_9ACTN|nr:endonuclease/exonuclease/phosphatase family protein [Nocardioides sp. CGMCC 1.13656]MBA2952489.1 endonuclease/exonuclease/phosphatase family protein [Nocardioides sp. CGMCC 1.13656]MVQ51651.1 endonuclease [Nocardioides sp. MAH-18]
MRIATWNLENLFAPGTGDAAPTSETAYQAKLEALATTIASIGPQVLAVQEVGPQPALDDLAAAVAAQTDHTWHTAAADPDGRGIRVALLSHGELRDVEQVRDLPAGIGPVQISDDGEILTGLGRPALKATVTLDGHDVHVLSVHLKSKLLTFPDGHFSTSDEDVRVRYGFYALARRAAEAAGVRAYVTRLLEDGGGAVPAVVVAGDLNDDVQAATTQLLHGPPGSEFETPGFDRPDAGDAQRLWNLAPLIPEHDRYSRIYRGRRELIDHILVSAPLTSPKPTVGAGPGAAPSIADDPDARRNEPGSDHRPVHAELG